MQPNLKAALNTDPRMIQVFRHPDFGRQILPNSRRQLGLPSSGSRILPRPAEPPDSAEQPDQPPLLPGSEADQLRPRGHPDQRGEPQPQDWPRSW